MRGLEMPELLPGLDVSRETISALEEYAALLAKWSSKINLVSKSDRKQLWDRHIMDSVQIIQNIGDTFENWVDLGSGGGLPGLVVSILSRELCPARKMILIESDQRKVVFLRTAIRHLNLSATVDSRRIEEHQNNEYGVVSARALAPLEKLISYSDPLVAKDGYCLFMKGRSWEKEVSNAQKEWKFHLEAIKSKTSEQAVILKIGDISRA